MKSAVVAAGLALASASEFHTWASLHAKPYIADPSSAEYARRKANFALNVENMNVQAKASPTAVFAPNQFFDLSEEEFFPYWHGLGNNKTKGRNTASGNDIQGCIGGGAKWTQARKEVGALPASFDWRDANPSPITPIKNQGQCGSCWAFSTIGAIEGAIAVKSGEAAKSLSEQSVVDCSKGCAVNEYNTEECNAGCNGGWQWTAFSDMLGDDWAGGIPSEDDYVYTGYAESCKLSVYKGDAKISNYTCVTPYASPKGASEDDMAAYLMKHGPLAFGMDASPLMAYSSGIIDSSSCDALAIDHAMQLVGFGSEPSPYWIVKNSWGTYWGENGYFRIVRGKGNCGLNNAVSAPVV